MYTLVPLKKLQKVGTALPLYAGGSARPDHCMLGVCFDGRCSKVSVGSWLVHCSDALNLTSGERHCNMQAAGMSVYALFRWYRAVSVCWNLDCLLTFILIRICLTTMPNAQASAAALQHDTCASWHG